MPKQPMIVGKPVLVVVDIQKGADMPADEVGIDIMPGGAERIARGRADRSPLPAKPDIPWCSSRRCTGRSGIDFGRELDGAETVHCLDGDRATELVDSLRPSRTRATRSSTS